MAITRWANVEIRESRERVFGKEIIDLSSVLCTPYAGIKRDNTTDRVFIVDLALKSPLESNKEKR